MSNAADKNDSRQGQFRSGLAPGMWLVLIGMTWLGIAASSLHSPVSVAGYIQVGAAAVAIFVGIGIMMCLEFRRGTSSVSLTTSSGTAEPELLVAQLGKNYEVLRQQTMQGFILAGVFMTLGLLVILAGSVGKFFGFATEGSNLTSIAGIIAEFISGTALVIYRINFERLNRTSDRLDATWRVLAAYRLAASLPDDKKAEATLRLIDALALPEKRRASTTRWGKKM